MLMGMLHKPVHSCFSCISIMLICKGRNKNFWWYSQVALKKLGAIFCLPPVIFKNSTVSPHLENCIALSLYLFQYEIEKLLFFRPNFLLQWIVNLLMRLNMFSCYCDSLMKHAVISGYVFVQLPIKFFFLFLILSGLLYINDT